MMRKVKEKATTNFSEMMNAPFNVQTQLTESIPGENLKNVYLDLAEFFICYNYIHRLSPVVNKLLEPTFLLIECCWTHVHVEILFIFMLSSCSSCWVHVEFMLSSCSSVSFCIGERKRLTVELSVSPSIAPCFTIFSLLLFYWILRLQFFSNSAFVSSLKSFFYDLKKDFYRFFSRTKRRQWL